MDNLIWYKSIRFYYLRDDQNRPLITICLLKDLKETIYRGIAICSDKDSPNKKTGRAIAFGRAVKAMKNKKEADNLNRKEVFDILAKVKNDFDFFYKSNSQPELTEFEVKLMY